jgi:2-iminobutanoate/2-iminopropanoate deaminase
MTKTAIETANAKAIGPYSLGIAAGDYVFLSGQIALDNAAGKLVEGGIEAQTEQVFRNIKTLLDAAGLDFADVVKSTVYMTNLADFQAMNAIYQKHVARPFPARSTVQVAALPMGAAVEIEMIAHKSNAKLG